MASLHKKQHRPSDRTEAWLARQGFGRAGDGGRERGEDDALCAGVAVLVGKGPPVAVDLEQHL